MFEAYSHSNHEGLIAASCIEKEVRFGSWPCRNVGRNGPVHLQTVRRLICIGGGLALLADPRWHRRSQAASLDTDASSCG